MKWRIKFFNLYVKVAKHRTNTTLIKLLDMRQAHTYQTIIPCTPFQKGSVRKCD